MYNGTASNPTVTDCLFTGNTGEGSGMYNTLCSPTIADCTFSSNYQGMSNNNSGATVVDCVFSDNGPGWVRGAGMRNRGVGTYGVPLVMNCVFTGNWTNSGGGGMYAGPATVIGCTFTGNSAAGGGGMQDSEGVVIGCVFRDNVAVGLGGGLESRDGYVVNCVFTGNTADWVGGGMANFSGGPAAINCTFVGNSAGQEGGGFCAYGDGFGTLTNCIVWGNEPDQAKDIYGAATTIRYSTVAGGWTGPGGHNTDADPLFVDPAIGDYRLKPGSPCIDAGSNWAVADLTSTDFDGNPRFADDPATADTGCGEAVVVDMGAYEYQGQPAQVVFADIDGDGGVALGDVEVLLDCWALTEEPCCIADLDVDGTVGVVDFLILLANWG
jgi:hypothetical protein